MSLISDALQKAGASPAVPPAPPGQKPGWKSGVLLAVAAGLAATLVARLPAHSPGTPVSTPQKISKPAPPLPQPSGLNLLKVAQGSWRLNGIVQGGNGRSLALINDQVVEEGHTVEGAKLVKVSQDEVELEQDGQVQTLKLH